MKTDLLRNLTAAAAALALGGCGGGDADAPAPRISSSQAWGPMAAPAPASTNLIANGGFENSTATAPT